MTDMAADLETETHNAAFKNTTSFIPVANVYVGAHTGDPGNDATANEVSAAEPVDQRGEVNLILSSELFRRGATS